MHRIPMPSPRGTNHAGLFLPADWPPSSRPNPVAAYDTMPRPRRWARDQFDPNSVRTLCDDIERLTDSLPEDRAAELFHELHQVMQAFTDTEDQRRRADDRRRRGYDEPPPFPGRPRPGGEMDPITTPIEDRRVEARRHASDSRRLALDAAGDADFYRRFPGARRLGAA